MNLYDQLKEKADLFIKYYRDDLLVHDKNALEKNPNVPFLHFTGETGTHLIFLWPASFYPEAGQKYPYLFGMTDRERELSELPSYVESMPRYNRGELTLHFDGKVLCKVSNKEAKFIADEYVQKVRKEWERETIKRKEGHDC